MSMQSTPAIANDERIRCERCDRELEPMEVRAKYLKSDFPTKVLACPVCGQIYIPESLVFGKIGEVERTLEEK